MRHEHSTTDSGTIDASDRVALGEALRIARVTQSLTQRDVELRCGISQGKVSRIERGQAQPPLSTLTQIAAAVGVRLHLSLLPLPSERE